MKSHICAGQFKGRSKKFRTLRCRCCVVMDLRDKHAAQTAHADMQRRLVDDYTFEEFMADICTDESPCLLCQRSRLKRATAPEAQTQE